MSQKRNITWNFEQNINWLQQKSKSRHCHTRATGEPDSQLEDPLEYLDLTGEFTFIGLGNFIVVNAHNADNDYTQGREYIFMETSLVSQLFL